MKAKQVLDRNNPLIDKNPVDTLANIQSMLARIQTFIAETSTDNNLPAPPSGNELYIRLLVMINEAIHYEIERFHDN
ncbi:MAG: hypothetical protein ACRBCI_07495 [Cellvibrionaceae bacterium]